MPRRPTKLLPLLLAALLAPAGCQKRTVDETPPAPPADPWAACEFIRYVPSDAEAFLWLRSPAETWRAVFPAWKPLWNDEGTRRWWQGTTTGRLTGAFLEAPRTPALLEALATAVEKDAFVVLGQGTGSQLAAWQQVDRLFAAARLRNLFTPVLPDEAPPEEEVPLEEMPDDLTSAAFNEVIVPLPPAMQETLEKFVREAAVPPIVIGMKISPDSPLPRLLEEWVASLPEKLPRDRVETEMHGAFTRVRLPVTMLVPTNVAVRARDILATNIGDVYAATYIVRDMLAKVTTLSFGWIHGHFVISVGMESGVPVLAASPEASLTGVSPLPRLEQFLGSGADAVFYANPLVVSLTAAPPPIAEYLDAAVEAALEFAPAKTIDPLREAAAPLREQAGELFRPRFSAVSGVVRQMDGSWQAELFGGSLAPRLALGNTAPLFAENDDVDLLWTENWEDGYACRLIDFSTGLAAFSADWTEALGPVFLDEKRKTLADTVLRAIGGPMETLRQGAGKLIEGALGPQFALAAAFDGTMPPPPVLPAAAEQAILPRVAVGAALRNREALALGWEEMSAAGKSAWPAPAETRETNGAVSYRYALPLGGPDLGAAVTIAGSRWILGTSQPFTAGVAALPAADGKTAVQSISLRTTALASFAAAWSAALTADPSLSTFTAGLVPADPETLSAAAEVLKTPRQFRYEARWDNDILHRTIDLSPVP